MEVSAAGFLTQPHGGSTNENRIDEIREQVAELEAELERAREAEDLAWSNWLASDRGTALLKKHDYATRRKIALQRELASLRA